MPTSGKIGTLKFNFADILESAFRRCKLNPAQQSVELVEHARKMLYLVLTSDQNLGINLWRTEHGFLGIVQDRVTYDLPAGSLDVLNLNFASNSVASGQTSAVAGGYKFVPAVPTETNMVGVKFAAPVELALTFATSIDGVSYSTQLEAQSAEYGVDRYYWYLLPLTETVRGVSVTSATSFTVSDVTILSQSSTVPMLSWNRDDYAMQPTRYQRGRPCTNYWYDRQLQPRLWVWPNPYNVYDFIEYWVHRQVQDIVNMTDEIDAPTHVLNAAIWMAARELCAIVPNIDPGAVQLVMSESDRIMREKDLGQTDGSGTFLQPMIGCYTRG